MVNILVSAILFHLAFPNPWNMYGLWPLAWIALIPLFMVLHNKSIKARFWTALAYGVMCYSLILHWLWPVHWAGTALFVLAMTLQPVVFALFYRTFDRIWLGVIYTAALWVASEWLRTLILKGFCWSLGYSQSFQPALIQIASLTGPYGVTFVIVVVNICLYQALRITSRRKMLLGSALAIFVVLYGLGTLIIHTDRKEQSSLSICAIQPNIPPENKMSLEDFDHNIESHIDLTHEALSVNKADIIVWPETSFPADVFKDPVWYPRLKKIAFENNAVFMFGAVPVIENKSFNSAVVLDEKGELVGVYDKQFLVPMSEYTFRFLSFPRKRESTAGIQRGTLWIPAFAGMTNRDGNDIGHSEFSNIHGFNFTAGKEQGILTVTNKSGQSIKFGALICSETCYPSLARRWTAQDAGFMIAILNDGWFTQPSAIMMHAQNAIMRAVESGRDIVSVGNTGLTFHVDAQGRISHALAVQEKSFGTFDVGVGRKSTLYSRIGDFFAEACALFVIIILVINIRNNFNRS